MSTPRSLVPFLLAGAIGAACGASGARPALDPAGGGYHRVDRLRFNQLAVRLELPVYWALDEDGDGAVDPSEVRSLLFYPTDEEWVRDGRFTEAFDRASAAIVAEHGAPVPSDERLRLVQADLDAAAPTLVYNDLRSLPDDHRAFARVMRRVAARIDALYAIQTGMAALAQRSRPADVASRSLFRRNWGPACAAPGTESEAACSAIAGSPRQPVDVYPESLQQAEGFCAALEARADSAALLHQFVAVRQRGGELVAVPYHEAYAEQARAIAAELREAAGVLTDPAEDRLRAYLRAAAEAFLDDDWESADDAWAAMDAESSRWYVRIGPDEVYWDPCSRKAGFHLTFALIDRASLEWQARLTPLQNDMERALASLVPGVYTARQVSFKMPDFIEIVMNAGDDRSPLGATIGQSLPNWGRVAEQSRGRTVAMTNLYTDPDSVVRRRQTAASLLTAHGMEGYVDSPTPGLLSTILHEATHNLGPAHEYRLRGRTSDEAFGGEMASMLEELKAQTGALFLLDLLEERGVVDAARARETRTDSIVWLFGHIARGMYTPDGHRKPYSQLAAIQLGFLLDHGAMTFDRDALAANGDDQGALDLHHERLAAASSALMTEVMRIYATQDRAGAEALAARYVDGDTVPHALITERVGRQPRVSFVYAVDF